MRSDGQVDLREWALAKSLERHVERRFHQGEEPVLLAHVQHLVMEDGAVSDVGTHAELLTRCDLYRRLVQTQLVG